MGKSRSFGEFVPQGVSPMDMIVHGQTFKVRGAMSGIQLLNLIRAMDGSGDSDSAQTLIGFIEKSLLTEDREKGMEFLETSEPPVPLNILTEIVKWLIEEYSGNPTGSSSPSSNGSEVIGSGSTDGPFSEESTSNQNHLTAVNSSQL